MTTQPFLLLSAAIAQNGLDNLENCSFKTAAAAAATTTTTTKGGGGEGTGSATQA